MKFAYIPFEEGEKHLDWIGLTEAFAAGHARPKAEIADTFLYRDPDTLLSRSAWIDGLGLAVKSCLLYTSPSPRDMRRYRMPSSA